MVYFISTHKTASLINAGYGALCWQLLLLGFHLQLREIASIMKRTGITECFRCSWLIVAFILINDDLFHYIRTASYLNPETKWISQISLKYLQKKSYETVIWWNYFIRWVEGTYLVFVFYIILLTLLHYTRPGQNSW